MDTLTDTDASNENSRNGGLNNGTFPWQTLNDK